MSRPNRASRICADHCSLLEFVAPRGATVCWVLWLLIAAAACAAADIGWPARVGVCFSLACTVPAFRQLAGTGGQRAVCAVGEDDAGVFIIVSGSRSHRLRVTSFEIQRFGNRLWVLRFTTLRGVFFRMIHPAGQNPRSLRRLLRRSGHPGRAAGRPIQAPVGE